MFHNVSIVIVDDEMLNLILLEELIKQEGYINYKTFLEPSKALEYAKENNVDALITDYNMPKMDGIELLQKMKALHPDMVSIMITANNDTEMMEYALQSGVTEFLLKPIFPITFKLRLKNILELAFSLVINKDFNKILQQKVEETTDALKESEEEILEVLSNAAEYKDPETASHIARVAYYSKLIAKKYGLDEEEQNILFYAAPLHDIGKIGIPDSILLKPGKLTKDEFEKMKEHSKIGAGILASKNNEYIKAGRVIARTHHEKYNGQGYPEGLQAENIPLFGRIVAIADVFDALTSQRPYKKAWTFENALNLLIEEKNEYFDPQLVDIFVDAQEEVKKIYMEFQEEV